MKVLVRKTDNVVDRILDSKECDDLMKSTPYQNMYFSVDLPTALESNSIDELKCVLVPVQAEYWSDGTTQYNLLADVPTITDANGNTVPDPAFIYYPEVPEHYEIQVDATIVKNNAIAKLKETAKEEIYTELETRFGSRDSANIDANFTTWKEMLADPALFVGTVATHDAIDVNGTIVVAKGSALVDQATVTSYATELVRLSKEYLVWRVNRYKKLTDDIALL